MDKIQYKDLPDTISPEIYAEWRNIGLHKAREKFHSKGFPLIKGMGTKLIADKRAVMLFDLGLDEKQQASICNKIAEQITGEMVSLGGDSSDWIREPKTENPRIP